MRIGLLGCGNIGRILADAIDREEVDCSLVAVFDQDIERARELATQLRRKPDVADSIEGLLQDTDLVVEAASQDAVRDYGVKVLDSGKDILIMSVGALADEALFNELTQLINKTGRRIYVPSGAIAGLDGIKAAKTKGIDSVELTTRKPPAELGTTTDKETIVYEGTAREGIKKFPKNVNVAATLSLVGMGFDKTKLRIIADPDVNRNVHEIRVVGMFGEFNIKMENLPSPNNPKTSYLAAMSTIATLKEINSAIQLGT
ncbi:MAG: aspartate dehydrogenase [Candidatus Altiarchaeales archaeon]|nr:aspartate dehydrogenase [Candidatus Altiarchaeota archaeon]MCG2783419.1 aspartate dehydrogenase [Candidatus Altiarchaeales archaeon]MBU4266577.1 aspartate dehydrogenase [Candidatus Altiarchaeota archaeon]MBU4341696.1 aspartate dehydrogenase [Candidatus Altiarchaeota archaeon]MBU4406453.1 aspartate dehydrogenase [Candidatus Altiarchaeota archaeon]